MELHQAVFFAALAGVIAFAVRRGGAPERCVGIALAVAALASVARPADVRVGYRSVEWGLFWIDFALLAALIIIALRANRYWPMWLAAVQLDTVAIHGVRAYDTAVWAYVYSRLIGLPAYPILALLVIGTVRHHRRVRAGDSEAGWVPLLSSARGDV